MVRRFSFGFAAVCLALLAVVAPAQAQTGSISGTVTNTNAPAAGIGVNVTAFNGDQFAGSTFSDPSTGAYTISGLPVGSYRLVTSNNLGLIDQVFTTSSTKIECGGCQLTTSPGNQGELLTVTSGGNNSGRDFALRAGPRIKGKITDFATGAALANVNVNIFRAGGFSSVTSGLTQTDGTFISGAGLPPGFTYAAITFNLQGYVDRIYNNVICIGGFCNLFTGTTITFASVTSPDFVADFTLEKGATIKGKLTNRATAAVLTSGSVTIFNSSGGSVGFAGPNFSGPTAGEYTSPGLPAGTYYVKAQTFGTPSFIGQLFDDIACTSCSATSGTPIVLAVGDTRTGVDFKMDAAGDITGTLRDATTSNPIANASVQVYAASGGSPIAFSNSTNTSGVYTVSGLSTGNYLVRASGPFSGSPSYISRVYTAGGGFDCTNCDVTGGSLVAVTAGASTPGIDLSLTQGGSISGTVVEDATGNPIQNVNVTVLNGAGSFVGSNNTNSSGAFTISGLLSGTYYLKTNASSSINFIPEIWAGGGTAGSTIHVTCNFCSVTLGTAISVTAGSPVTGKDFRLLAGRSISGTITNASGTPLGGISVSVFDADNSSFGGTSTNSSGVYTIAGLAPRTYFVRTFANGGFLDEVFNDILCLNCSANGGTPVDVSSANRTDVNFSLAAGGRISGKITDPTGAPLASSQSAFVGASVFTSTGFFVTSVSTGADGTFITGSGLPPGTYYVSSSNSRGYINTLWDNISCSNCPATSGTPIVVAAGATAGGINLQLKAGAAISGFLKQTDGSPIPNAFVQVYSSTGSFVSSTSTNSQGKYTLGGLLGDSYFVRTSNGVGFIDQLFGGGTCLGCDVTTGSLVVTSTTLPATSTCPAATKCDIDFVLTAGGTISGTVTDTSSTPKPLANVSVQVYNSSGAFITSISTQANGTYAVKGLATGSYFARTFNSLGFINLLEGSPADIVCGSCTITSGAPIPVTAGGTTGNVNFALDPGSILKGRVTTTDATPVGIGGVSVSVVTSTGSTVAGASTDFQGNYTINGIVPGTYFLKTFNSQGFIDQVFKGIECLGCTVTAGTPVTLGVGTTTLGPADDFKLPTGGRIRGKVTDADGKTLAGVTVEVYRSSGSFATLGTTTAQGTYVSNIGLPPGDYVVKTRNTLGYVDKLYDNVTCLNCSVTTGKLVTLTNEAASTLNNGEGGIESGVSSAANIDFVLASGGGISGSVKKTDGTPLQGIFVQIYSDTGSFISSTSTNGLGNYVLKGVPTGTYFARTSNSIGYIDQLWEALPCSGCLVSGGKPIAVTVGTVTPGINFNLTVGGRVSGVVTSAATGNPIGSVSVQVFNLSGTFVASGFTSSNGTYVTGGLPAGEYYVKTFNSVGFINQLHSGIVCQSCTVTGGTKVSVTLGNATTVNFSLATGGSISGTVTNRTTNAPLANLNVQVLTSTGSFFSSFNTNASGVYTIGGLPTGSYTVRTSNSNGFIDRLYDDLECISCTASSGKPVAVTVGSPVTGIDFKLEAGGLVSGTVTDAGSGKPIAGIGVQLFNASNFFMTSGTTDNLGKYTMRAGVPAGTYYARTSNSIGFINVTYPDNTCLNCPFTIGTPIPVTLGQTTTGIDFALSLGGRITGTITDAATGLPLSGVSISLSLADGTSVGGGGTNSLGFYSTQGLPAGTYYARTNNGLGYINRLYNGIDCVRCATGVGTPIGVTVGATTSGINFALSPGARVSGTITDAVTNLPLGGINVTIADASGFGVTGATTNAAGQYLTSAGLTPGTYYARTQNQSGYVNKLYDTFVCLQCNMTTGKPITLTAGVTTTGINFALSPGGRIAGTITAGGVGVANAFVDLFSAGGTFLTGVPTGSAGQYITGEGLPPGQYYLVTENMAGLIDQLYNGNNVDASRPILECGFTCAVTSGKAVDVVAGATTPNISWALNAGGRISGRVISSATGVGLPNIQLSVHNTVGAWVAYANTDGLGRYTTAGGVPTGSYFVRTNSSNRLIQYVNEVYNNTACAGCDPTKGTPVPVTSSPAATTPNIDFALDSGETISGSVKDAATNLPISGANVRIFDGSGNFVAGGGTDDSGAYTITSALPAGTYFARTFNGRGYVDRVYDTDVCLACDVTRGTPITVDGVGSTGGINFVLTPGGRITGTVTATTGGATVAGSKIRFFNSAGSFIGQTFTNGAGVYTSFGLPPGKYFVRTANTSGLIDELYDNVPCVPCNMSQGTAVTVVTAGLKGGVDFSLGAGGLISGYVKDQATGSPIPNVTVSVYRASDGVLVATTDPTDTNGYYQISLPVGTYQVEPNPVAGFRPVLPGGLRGPLARSTVTVDTDSETTGVGFALVSCAPITVNPSTLPLAAQGQLYSSTFSATGGTGPFTFSITDGTVNTGLALTPAGLLGGAPVFAGTGNFTVAAMDANQCAGTRAFALTACSFFLSTPSVSTTANVGNGTVALTASAADCPWVITTTDSWITVTSAVNGTGNATVAFSYAFNSTGAARSGTLRIGGQVFTITQGAPSSTPAFGLVDTPAAGATGINGSLAVTGWALDDIEVRRIVVSRDPVAGEGLTGDVYLGDATLVDGARPDVAAANPTLPFKTRAGWGYLLLTNMLPNQGNGTFTLHIDAHDAEGAVTRLGSRTFVGDNANAVTPFGAIDTPGQGATISGTNFVNFGWALTPNPKSIPTNGSTITVYVDGAPVGNPTYNNFRADVAGLFPGLANTGGAIGFRVFDTTTLTNGVHTISWVVFDDAGQGQGIGSRYFTVNNILASQRFAPPPLASMRAQATATAAATAAPQGPPVSVRVGFDRNQPMVELGVDSLGGRFVAVGQLGRMELRFGQACGVVKGVQIANGEQTPLPVGTTLDGSGSFHWMPGPAFLGTYQLEFSVPSCGGGETRIPVTVAVLPGR